MAGLRLYCVVGFILAVTESILTAPALSEVRNKRQVAGFAINTGTGTSSQGPESSSSTPASSSIATTTRAPFEFQRARPNFGPDPSASLGGALSGIPGLASSLSNMDLGQLVAKVAEWNSQGRLSQYLGMAEMFLGLPRGQGSDLDRANAIIDAAVTQPEQAALIKAQVTSVLTNGAVPASLAGNPASSVGPSSRLTPSTTPDNIQVLISGTDLNRYPGSGFGTAGNGFPGSGLPGNGFPGSGLPGSGIGPTGNSWQGQPGGAGGLPSVLGSDRWQPGGQGLQGLLGMLGSRGGNSGSPLDNIMGLLGGGGRREVSLGDLVGLNGGGSGLGPVVGQSPEGREAQRIFGIIGDVSRFIFGNGPSNVPNQNGLFGLLSRMGVNIRGQGGNQRGQGVPGGQGGQGNQGGQGGLGGLGDLLSLLG